MEVFKNQKATKRLYKWELDYQLAEQEIPSWWDFHSKFRFLQHFQWESPVSVFKGKFYEGDNKEPFEFELQSIKGVSLRVTVPKKVN